MKTKLTLKIICSCSSLAALLPGPLPKFNQCTHSSDDKDTSPSALFQKNIHIWGDGRPLYRQSLFASLIIEAWWQWLLGGKPHNLDVGRQFMSDFVAQFWRQKEPFQVQV